MRNKLLLVSALLCLSAPTANAGGLTAKSLEALKKYCIPDPAVVTEASTTVCGSIFEGQYDTRLKKCNVYTIRIWNGIQYFAVAKLNVPFPVHTQKFCKIIAKREIEMQIVAQQVIGQRKKFKNKIQ